MMTTFFGMSFQKCKRGRRIVERCPGRAAHCLSRVRTEEQFSSGRCLQHLNWRFVEHLHDAGELLDLVLAGEQWAAGVEFGDDAAEAPHVDRRRVRQTEDHLGRTVEPRLDVGVYYRTHTDINKSMCRLCGTTLRHALGCGCSPPPTFSVGSTAPLVVLVHVIGALILPR